MERSLHQYLLKWSILHPTAVTAKQILAKVYRFWFHWPPPPIHPMHNSSAIPLFYRHFAWSFSDFPITGDPMLCEKICVSRKWLVSWLSIIQSHVIRACIKVHTLKNNILCLLHYFFLHKVRDNKCCSMSPFFSGGLWFVNSARAHFCHLTSCDVRIGFTNTLKPTLEVKSNKKKEQLAQTFTNFT